MSNPARVYLVGTGPGDPDLLTIKALRLIQDTDVIIYDRLVSDAILDLIPAGTTRIYVGKETGNHTVPQQEINQLLVKLADAHHRIVRLKGGDPFVFGRGSEEAMWLVKHNIPFEIVPGITAASACTTYAGIPLTHRGLAQGVQIITGHSQQDGPLELDWTTLADASQTLVVYMGLANIKLICEKLVAAGLAADTPSAAIQNGTMAQQQCLLTTLGSLADETHRAKLCPPVIFVIGKVVSLADSLDWFGVNDGVNHQFLNSETTSYG